MPVSRFHPIIQEWFTSHFNGPTEPQRLGWPVIAEGRHTLLSAPTGSGKTLTAFLAVIDQLFREAMSGQLADEMRVVYVSPLRALSNDMQRNLEIPLQEISAAAEQAGLEHSPIRIGLRTGDTPAHRRAALVRRPPHIMVTTPESLYLMLTARKSRETLRSVETIIIDEIHALVRDKRGSHLSLSVERLAALTEKPLQRIGLSATQKPIEQIAACLLGVEETSDATSHAIPVAPCLSSEQQTETLSRPESIRALEPRDSFQDVRSRCAIIDVGHQRNLDLAIEVPPSELSAVCSHEQWAEINARLVELINQHHSTLIFVNTRRLAERLTFQLTELLGEDAVGAHHGSLASEIRLDTERRLKSGDLKAVVATASLELGIDVGYIDQVIQIGSPRSIATFLQRVGRSGHALGRTPRGRLFALTRDELLECMALVRAIHEGRLDAIPIPTAPLDILAQQIVAELSAREWKTDELFQLVRRAYPFRDLARQDFDETIEYLSEGLTSASGRSRALLHYDRVNQRLRARRNARLTALSNAGAIPEIDSIRVVAEPDMTIVGSVDEDFGVESSAGDIFLLGNTSWRILALRGNDLIVADAQGAPPTIPFWRGEAPGRTVELSEEISRLRLEIEQRAKTVLNNRDPSFSESIPKMPELLSWLIQETNCTADAAEQAIKYIVAQHEAVGFVPSQQQIFFERFFDETGGMQLVVHAPFGGRINRAWGLAMRKRFCRSFDFELQATADDDGFILSLGPQHSFPIESLFPMLRSDNARQLLEQALLAVPMFHLRWRWNATRALQVDRMRNGKKVPPALQRFRSEDLLTAVFPKLTGCQEEHTGDHIIPDHPLVRQTVLDCLHEALDFTGLTEVLGRIESGEITLLGKDTREPSPFAYELLNANPYAFLDGGEIQERRTRMAGTHRSLTVESVRDLGRLDPAAITQVIQEAQPIVRDADEMHDLLLSRVLLPGNEAQDTSWTTFLQQLRQEGRAALFHYDEGHQAWVAAERLPAVQALFPKGRWDGEWSLPQGVRKNWEAQEARILIVRGLLEISGPVTADEIARLIGIEPNQTTATLEALEGEGIVLRGHFRPATANDSQETEPRPIEWCHRGLLTRIHRLTVAGLRREIQPVDVPTYLRFLARHQGLIDEQRRGTGGLFETIGQLQGLDLAAVAWEKQILPTRVQGYQRAWLDELCLTGEVGWGRLYPPRRESGSARPMAAITRVAPISLFLREDRDWLFSKQMPTCWESLSSPAQQVLEQLWESGATFATDLLTSTKLLPDQLDDALGELVSRGVVTSDGFQGLRTLIREEQQPGTADTPTKRSAKLVRRRRNQSGIGRWSIWRMPSHAGQEPALEGIEAPVIEQWAWLLLRRWGVVFRDLLLKEPGAPKWWQLLQAFRRLEARGEIRGGRFISGVGGEQYALPHVVARLRQLRLNDHEHAEEWLLLSAADPLNLVGIISEGPRVPSHATNQLVYHNGHFIAALEGGQLRLVEGFSAELLAQAAQRLGVSLDPHELPSEIPKDRHAERFERRKKSSPRLPKFPRPMFS